MSEYADNLLRKWKRKMEEVTSNTVEGLLIPSASFRKLNEGVKPCSVHYYDKNPREEVYDFVSSIFGRI